MNRVEKTHIISEHNNTMLLSNAADWIWSDSGHFGIPYPYLLESGTDC